MTSPDVAAAPGQQKRRRNRNRNRRGRDKTEQQSSQNASAQQPAQPQLAARGQAQATVNGASTTAPSSSSAPVSSGDAQRGRRRGRGRFGRGGKQQHAQPRHHQHHHRQQGKPQPNSEVAPAEVETLRQQLAVLQRELAAERIKAGIVTAHAHGASILPTPTPFPRLLPHPPEMVPFVPVVAPLNPSEIEPVNSGTSSHSDTDSEYGREEDEDEESDSEEEDEDDEDEEDEDEDEEGEDDEADDDAEAEEEDGSDNDDASDDDDEAGASDRSHSRRASDSSNDRRAAHIMDSADLSSDESMDKHDRQWLLRFGKRLARAKGKAHAKKKGTKKTIEKDEEGSSEPDASLLSLEDVQAGKLTPEVISAQIEIERKQRAQHEATSVTPLQSSPSIAPVQPPGGAASSTTVTASTAPTLSSSLHPSLSIPPRHAAELQDAIRAYILAIKQQQYETRRRIKRQEYNFEHGIEDSDEEEGQDDDDDNDDEGDDVEDGKGENKESKTHDEESGESDADDGEDDESIEESDDDDDDQSSASPAPAASADGLHSFMRAQFKKKPKSKPGSASKPKKQKDGDESEGDESDSVDVNDVQIGEVSERMSELNIGQAANAITTASTAALSFGTASTTASSPSSSTSPLSLPPLVPIVRSAEEAEAISHSQSISPLPPDHHVPAHKHPHHCHTSTKTEEEEGKDDTRKQQVATMSAPTIDAARSRSSSVSSSSSSSSSSSDSDDRFPYEKNIFSLCPSYHFIRRLYTCDDAVTYKAFSKLTNQVVAIKICDGYDRKTMPKEVKLLNSAQGHTNICVMNGWHPFPSNHCYAIVTEFIENEPIESIFGQPSLHKVYMRDMLMGIKHLHERHIIFRDIKPSNVLWSKQKQKAIIIDFDVGSYFDPVHFHRSMVGTDGYMAPEQMAIKHAKRRKYPLPYRGYGLEVDIYAAGIVLAQLLFSISEDDVADLDNLDAKGEAFIQRCMDACMRGEATLAHHLLVQMINPEPKYRITIDQALNHPWFIQ